MTRIETVSLKDGPLDGRSVEIDRDGGYVSQLFYEVDGRIHQYQARGGGAYYTHFAEFDEVPPHYGPVSVQQPPPEVGA